jgi:hypothetical protein
MKAIFTLASKLSPAVIFIDEVCEQMVCLLFYSFLMFKSWKQPLAEMQGKTTYMRPKVVRPFPGPCASGSYVHRATFLFFLNVSAPALTFITIFYRLIVC